MKKLLLVTAIMSVSALASNDLMALPAFYLPAFAPMNVHRATQVSIAKKDLATQKDTLPIDLYSDNEYDYSSDSDDYSSDSDDYNNPTAIGIKPE